MCRKKRGERTERRNERGRYMKKEEEESVQIKNRRMIWRGRLERKGKKQIRIGMKGKEERKDEKING